MGRLGLKDTIVEYVRQGSLIWLGHVLRKNDGEWVKQAWSFELEGSRGRGRLKLDWKTMIEKECCKVGVQFLDAKDRAKLRCWAKSWKESQ